MQVIMLTYLTVTLTTLGVAHLYDDGPSQKVSRYSTNHLISLTTIGSAPGFCSVVLVEYPLSCNSSRQFMNGFLYVVYCCQNQISDSLGCFLFDDCMYY